MLSTSSLLTWIVHEEMIAPSAFSKMLMLRAFLAACWEVGSRERAVILRRACNNIGLFRKHIVSVIQVYTYFIKCKFSSPCCRKSVYQVRWKHSLISAWCGMSLGKIQVNPCKLSWFRSHYSCFIFYVFSSMLRRLVSDTSISLKLSYFMIHCCISMSFLYRTPID